MEQPEMPAMRPAWLGTRQGNTKHQRDQSDMHYNKQLDDTWRLVQRGYPQGINPNIDGRDCYVFQRAGGEPGAAFTTHVIPVKKFWPDEQTLHSPYAAP
jgi:hypothetical protein